MRYEHDNSAKWDPKNRMKTKSPEAQTWDFYGIFMGFLRCSSHNFLWVLKDVKGVKPYN